MVRKGIELDEFDSVKYVYVPAPPIPIGSGTTDVTTDVEVELYDKNLVLTSKWDKLPVLEKIDISTRFEANLVSAMQASGIQLLCVEYVVYNCEADDIDIDHMIDAGFVSFMNENGVLRVHNMVHTSRDFNVPLRNKITIRSIGRSNVNVAAANLAGALTHAKFFLNIDYVKYTPEQLKDWILKEVFIEQ